MTYYRTARNSKPLEVLGTYNPLPQPPRPGDTTGRPFKEIKLDSTRARYWIGVGAHPSDTAWRLLSMVRLNGFPVIFWLRFDVIWRANLHRCWANGVVSRRMLPNLVDALATSVTD